MKRSLAFLAVGLALYAVPGPLSHAGGTSTSSMEKSNGAEGRKVSSVYDLGVDAATHGDFGNAEELFQKALQADPENPDTLNQLAHAQRKNGRLDEALENYKKALALRPNFPEAREYLGEAYLQAAMRELATLRGYGDAGKEQAEDLAKEIRETGKDLKDPQDDE